MIIERDDTGQTKIQVYTQEVKITTLKVKIVKVNQTKNFIKNIETIIQGKEILTTRGKTYIEISKNDRYKISSTDYYSYKPDRNLDEDNYQS